MNGPCLVLSLARAIAHAQRLMGELGQR